MQSAEAFLIALAIIFSVPYVVWRLGRLDDWAPLVVVQIATGIALGPGVLGAAWPEYYSRIFQPAVIQALNGIGTWAVVLFVLIAGVELDLRSAWAHRRESAITACLALCTPLVLGGAVALVWLRTPGWIGDQARPWQFVAGVGMACAVTALPILILFLEKLDILRATLGQRVLRYASLDDVAVWGVLAAILMDWNRIGRQAGFLGGFVIAAWCYRAAMSRLAEADRWFLALVWLIACAWAADWCGLHYMVGAFLAGAATEMRWFDQDRMDALRRHVLLVLMPVFFLGTGLRTSWGVGGSHVFAFAAVLFVAQLIGKLLGVRIAARILGWRPGEAALIGWLLQTKALIMIIFTGVLLDRGIITNDAFTALLLMAIASTMVAVPLASRRLKGLQRPVPSAASGA